MRFTRDIRNTILINFAGEKIGSVKDLIIDTSTKFPKVLYIDAELDRTDRIGNVDFTEPAKKIRILIPWDQIGSFRDYKEKKIKLKVHPHEIEMGALDYNKLLVGQHILDQQILNHKNIGLGRVDDVVLIEDGDKLVMVGLCVGVSGILQQLGFDFPVEIINKLLLLEEIKQDIIPWNYVLEYKPKKSQIKLRGKDTKDVLVKIVADNDEEAKKIVHKRKK